MHMIDRTAKLDHIPVGIIGEIVDQRSEIPSHVLEITAGQPSKLAAILERAA